MGWSNGSFTTLLFVARVTWAYSIQFNQFNWLYIRNVWACLPWSWNARMMPLCRSLTSHARHSDKSIDQRQLVTPLACSLSTLCPLFSELDLAPYMHVTSTCSRYGVLFSGLGKTVVAYTLSSLQSIIEVDLRILRLRGRQQLLHVLSALHNSITFQQLETRHRERYWACHCLAVRL